MDKYKYQSYKSDLYKFSGFNTDESRAYYQRKDNGRVERIAVSSQNMNNISNALSKVFNRTRAKELTIPELHFLEAKSEVNDSMEITTMTNTTLIEAPKRVRIEEEMKTNEPRAIAQGAMMLKGERVVPIPSIKGVSLTITDDELDFDVDALLKELAKMKLGGMPRESELVEITEYDSNGAVSKKEEIVKIIAPNKLMRPASEWTKEFFDDVLTDLLTCSEYVPELKATGVVQA